MVLNNVKRLLAIKLEDYSKDEVISTVIDLVTAKVKIFCNISNDNPILKDFDFLMLIAQIAADTYNCYKPAPSDSNNEEEAQRAFNMPQGEVKSVTIADYKVEYNVASKSQNFSSSSMGDAVNFNLDKYDEELANFRYVRFY